MTAEVDEIDILNEEIVALEIENDELRRENETYRAALEAILPHIPTSRVKDGGAVRHSAHVAAADKVRDALGIE